MTCGTPKLCQFEKIQIPYFSRALSHCFLGKMKNKELNFKQPTTEWGRQIAVAKPSNYLKLNSENFISQKRCLLNKILSSRFIILQLIFQPLRPIRASAMLVITGRSIGRWVFELVLEAKEPRVDDIIRIESAINTTTSVAFRLTNHTDTSAKFEVIGKFMFSESI